MRYFLVGGLEFSVARFMQKEMRRTEQHSKRYRKLVTTLETLQKYVFTCYNSEFESIITKLSDNVY